MSNVEMPVFIHVYSCRLAYKTSQKFTFEKMLGFKHVIVVDLSNFRKQKCIIYIFTIETAMQQIFD